MQDSIKRINDQQYTKESDTLVTSESKIELCLSKDEVYRGTVEMAGRSGREFTAYVYSSDYRMQPGWRQKTGSRLLLEYEFDASGMEYGDTRKGEICIVTGFGQFFLLYEAKVVKKELQSSLGPIKNLFHFVNLAKLHWDEAVSVFYSDAFADILVGADRQYLTAYLGLSKYKYNQQNMDEFLILTNKKQMQVFRLKEEEMFLEVPAKDRGEIRVERNGWGYTNLKIAVMGEFIRLEKQVLTDDDFTGDVCHVPFQIKKEKLHQGKNFGKILLKGMEVSLHFDLTVKWEQKTERNLDFAREQRWLEVHMMQTYIDYRSKKLDHQQWLTQSEEYVRHMLSKYSDCMLGRLYQTHLLLERERANEAKWILKHVADILEQGEGTDYEYAYYLYLTSRCEQNEKQVEGFHKELARLCRSNPTDFRIYWLRMQIDEGFFTDTSASYQSLESQFRQGSNSPLLYLEAFELLYRELKLFCRIGSFEIQILRFAVKHEMLTEDILKRAAGFSVRSKVRENDLLPILEYGYKKFGSEVVLQAICGVLIQHACTDTRYFPYMQKAVEKGMRLTRLYEYYMLTMDLDQGGPLPKAVLLFFSYECHLDYERKAYVLASACRQKEELGDAFLALERQIPDFIRYQIMKGHMNDELAYLYENYLGELTFDEQLASYFVKLVFKYRIKIEREDIRNVIVVHEQLNEERIYPVSGQEAYASVYTDESCILLEDAEHNRYVTRGRVHIDPLLLYKKLAYLLGNFELQHMGFMLYLCENQKAYSMIDENNASAFTKLLLSSKVADHYKQQFGKRLLKYYYEKDNMSMLRELIENIKYSNVAPIDRDDVVRYMLFLDLDDLAYDFVMKYGFDQISSKTLAKICERRLKRTLEASLQVLWLCFEVFKRGKAGEILLSYLTEHFEGTIKQMKEIWQSAKEKKVDTVDIEKRILAQILFCDGYLAQKEEIFHSYMQNVQTTDDLMRAYVSQNCYDYFVRDSLVGEHFFDEVTEMIRRGEQVALVCRLAYVKYYASVKAANGDVSAVKPVLVRFLNELIEQRYFFSFFLVYKDWIPMMLPRMERSYIEYRCQPGAKVTIHYLIAKEGGQISDYLREPMTEIYDGYYSKSFCLFFSQQLQYYITIEEDGTESFVESGELEKLEVTDVQQETRFSLLNDILISMALQDRSTTRQLVQEYEQEVFTTEQFFQLR